MIHFYEDLSKEHIDLIFMHTTSYSKNWYYYEINNSAKCAEFYYVHLVSITIIYDFDDTTF